MCYRFRRRCHYPPVVDQIVMEEADMDSCPAEDVESSCQIVSTTSSIENPGNMDVSESRVVVTSKTNGERPLDDELPFEIATDRSSDISSGGATSEITPGSVTLQKAMKEPSIVREKPRPDTPTAPPVVRYELTEEALDNLLSQRVEMYRSAEVNTVSVPTRSCGTTMGTDPQEVSSSVRAVHPQLQRTWQQLSLIHI